MTDPIKFVQEIQLAYPKNAYEFDNFKNFRSTLEAGESNEQAFLANTSLISFAKGVSAEYRQDVLNSVLIAQLAANYSFPDKKDLVNWNNECIRVLTGLGWVIQKKRYKDDNTTHGLIEIENNIRDIITTAIGGSLVTIAKTSLNAFKKLSEASNSKIIAFEKNSHTLSEGSFQVGAADKNNQRGKDKKQVILKMGTFILSSRETIQQILFFKANKDDTELKIVTFEIALNMEAYAPIRNIVKEKLGEKVVDFVTELKLNE